MKRNILIINTCSIYAENATGITLRALFSKFDYTKCLEISLNLEQDKRDNLIKTIKPHYSTISVAKLLQKFRKSKLNNVIKKNEIERTQTTRKKSIVSYLRQYIALLPDQCRLYLSKEDQKKIASFSPDVIYTLGGSVNILQLSHWLSLEYNIPIVIHHMDNWLNCIQWKDNFMLRTYEKRLKEYCIKCYKRTTQCITISDGMASKFTDITKVEHVAIMNSIDCAKMRCSCNKNKHSVFRFLYAGGLHLERYNALKEFAALIEEYNQNSENQAELYIYTGQTNIDLFGKYFDNFTATSLFPSVPHEHIKDIYEESDALIHVESSTILNNDFFKYSISTKISEYLATGKPVIFYGPASIYLFKFLKANNIASVAKNKEELRIIIKTFIEQSDSLEEMTRRAREFAEEHFEIEQTIRVLKKVVDEVRLPN